MLSRIIFYIEQNNNKDKGKETWRKGQAEGMKNIFRGKQIYSTPNFAAQKT
jgi:hypothetical protein